MPCDAQSEKRVPSAETKEPENVLNISGVRLFLLRKHFWNIGIRRDFLFERDRGVCALCGLDTQALDEALGYICRHIVAFAPGWEVELAAVKRAIGPFVRGWPKSLWEGDHIMPTALGGADIQENWRTLCLRCHKAETARLRAWIAVHPLFRVLGVRRSDRYQPTLGVRL